MKKKMSIPQQQRYQSQKPPMYSYAGNQQESEQEDPKQLALSMKRPSTREKMDANSAKMSNPYFSRTMNQ